MPVYDSVITDQYAIYNGDAVEVLRELPEDSIDLSVFSPPFAQLFVYSSDIADMGNSDDSGAEFNLHFRFFAEALFRVMKPGRNVCLHLQQLVAFVAVHQRKGLRDFRGAVRQVMEDAGFWYFREAVIPKNPQAQALRTNAHELLFATLERDSADSAPALNDYVLIFKKPGKNAVPVKAECNRVEWVKWACGVWGDIQETKVLSVRNTKGEEEEKHICPLQLEVYERFIRLYSNRGEAVLDPFGGIGSCGHVAGAWGRRVVSTELKPSYYRANVENTKAAYDKVANQPMFDFSLNQAPTQDPIEG